VAVELRQRASFDGPVAGVVDSACKLAEHETVAPKSLELLQPSIMLNIIGGATPDSHLKATEAALSSGVAPPMMLSMIEGWRSSRLLGGMGRSRIARMWLATEAALSIPNASIHLYSKGAAKPGRKMGHVTVT
jgi:phosphoribosylaminoimidazole carboxylase